MMSNIDKIREQVLYELQSNILPYWMNNMQDDVNGGFYGRIDGNDVLVPNSPKGAILNARILWTFSAAYRVLKRQEYLNMATRAKDYLINNFIDKTYGGVYWELDAKGNPLDTKKQIYAIGFAIYGLSEYSRATGNVEALEISKQLFESIEEHSFDKELNGYWEAFARDWETIEDVRLSEKDENEKKTMNTHLHILEPYTNLYRVWKDPRLKKQIENLINIFIEKIYDPTSNHMNLFFENDWTNKYDVISYGHDIEASWLIYEAACVLNDKLLIDKVLPVVQHLADSSCEGLNPDGSLIYECYPRRNTYDKELHWWVQAENVVGHFNLYQIFGNEKDLNIVYDCWNYIKMNLVDSQHGEWYWSRYETGNINHKDDKAGFWKCPYHNSRMCLEIYERTKV